MASSTELDQSPQNAADRAYQYLLQQAVTFGIRPAERVNEVEIAAALDMSRAPVREALNRLVTQGLVISKRGKGFFGRRLSATELADLMEVRSDLELSAVRKVIANVSDEDIEALVDTSRSRPIDPLTMTIDQMVAVDEAFHLGIVAAGGNSERVRVLENINNRIQFVRRIVLEQSDRQAEVIREHDDILDAIKNRDAELATRLLEKHLQVNSENFIDSLQAGLARIYADVLT